MKLPRPFRALAALAIIAGCSDNSTAPVKPAAIQLVAGDAQTGTAGRKVAVSPTFLVTDASGNPLSGVRVSVAISAGNGTLVGAPSSSGSAATSIGTWTLGTRPGANAITVTVDGIAPLVINARAHAGAAARLVPSTPTTIGARVGDVASPAPSVTVLDAFDNPVAGANLAVTVSAGTAPASIVSDAQGVATISPWQLGTVTGQSVLAMTAGAATMSFIANLAPADPARLLVSGGQQRGRAGAPVAPIVLRVVDRFGNTIGNQAAAFTITAGGGLLAATSANSSADGAIALPAWTLGRSAVPQTIHAVAGALSADITVPVASDYRIDVRFFGPDMTAAQKAWFENAAARISAIITGDIPDVAVANLNVTDACGIAGLPTLTETIDDLVIYASVANIDGPGKILAQAGPCVLRNAAGGGLTAVGVMRFDAADMDRMSRDNITQEVITHEMLHVVGVGTLWLDRHLITAAGTAAVTYWGAGGKQGCIDGGGSATCAASVPVENNLVLGTTDAHWRESTFGNELMTGYANVGGMPLSAITVGSMGDLGYDVNPFAADPFRIPGAGGATGNRIPGRGATEEWEQPLPAAVVLGKAPADPPTRVRRTPK